MLDADDTADEKYVDIAKCGGWLVSVLANNNTLQLNEIVISRGDSGLDSYIPVSFIHWQTPEELRVIQRMMESWVLTQVHNDSTLEISFSPSTDEGLKWKIWLEVFSDGLEHPVSSFAIRIDRGVDVYEYSVSSSNNYSLTRKTHFHLVGPWPKIET